MEHNKQIWHEWYAWHPVRPDDNGIFWLETVWRRRHPQTGRWQYRSFRPDCDKRREERDQEDAFRDSW